MTEADRPADPPRRGAPTKLTREKIKEIATAVELGNYIDTAGAAAGLSKGQLHEWMRKGRRLEEATDQSRYTEEDRLFMDFARSIREALAKSEMEALQLVRQGTNAGGFPDWRASAWRLERKHPDRWGRRSEVKVTQTPDMVSRDELDYTKMSDAQLDAFIAGVEVATADRDPNDSDPEDKETDP